jgi:NAD(P)-dependent dehydrogenase (short-subunit alcohol dehydrogenase family)
VKAATANDALEMSMRNDGELGTLIVTGASRGIGAAIATLAGIRGYAVIVNFRAAASRAKGVVDQILAGGGKALAIKADVSQEEDVVRMYEKAEDEFGQITGLVNNAAVTGGFARVEDVSLETIQRVFEVNVIGAILCSREAVRRMSTRRGGTGGSIVNISSRATHIGSPGEWIHYAASKGAIDTFTIGLAREVASEGIRVNAVAPGLIHTELHAESGAPDRLQRLVETIPMQRVGQPIEVAEAVLWLLSPASSYVAGEILSVGGGR